jgi:type I restriction enzyme S subunit
MKMKTAATSKKLRPIKKQGNKHPNLGLIPNGWEVLRFADVFEFLPTNSFSRDQMTYGGDKNSIYNIHYGDIHATFNEQILDFNKHIHQIPVLLDTTEVRSNDNAFLKDGDLIIADASEDYNGVGECIEITGINKRKVLGGLHTITARDIKGKTTQGFRAYLLKNPRVFINLKKLATGSKVYGISKGNVAELELVVPPLPEQQKIARILSTWDKAIEKTELLIAQKQQLKKGLMQQMLTGKMRFKEFVKSKRMKKTKLGLIPEDWNLMAFTEFTELRHGFQFRDEHFCNSGIVVVKIGSLADGKGLKLNDSTYVPQEDLHKFEKFLLKRGDILMALTGGSLGKVSRVDTDILLLQNYRVGNFIPSKLSSLEYIYQLLQSFFVQQRIKNLVNEAAQPNFGKQDFDKIFIPLPPLREQSKIAYILQCIDREINLLNNNLHRLRSQKVGLMQMLLVGEVRVKQK